MSVDLKFDIQTQHEIQEAVSQILSRLPEQLGIDESIPGCEVISMDTYSVGVGVLPRYITVALRGGPQVPVFYRGGISGLGVGDDVLVTHFRDGDRYEVTGPGGATGSNIIDIHDHSDNTQGGANLHDIEELELADPTTLTIAGGIVTRSQAYHTIDTEGGAATDNLDTINGGAVGDILVIKPESGARTIVIKHNTGNIWILGAADVTLDDADDHILLVYDGTYWCSVDSGSGGGGGGGAGVWLAASGPNLDFSPDTPAVVTDAGVVTEYATITLAIAAAISGEFVVIPPGTYDESFTLKDGVKVVELFTGTVIIESTSADTAITTSGGGYINVKEIRVTRNTANTLYAVMSSHATGSCTIRTEIICANNTGDGDAFGVYQSGEGTLICIGDYIQAYGIGGWVVADSCEAAYCEAGTQYIWAKQLFASGKCGWTIAAEAHGGTQYIHADCHSQDDEYCIAAYCGSGSTQIIWGDCSAYTDWEDEAMNDAYGVYKRGVGTQTVYGNCTAYASLDIAYGMTVEDGGDQIVYGSASGNCPGGLGYGIHAARGFNSATINQILYGNAIGTGTTGIGAVLEGNQFASDTINQYVHGDVTGATYGAAVIDGGDPPSAGITQTITFGCASGGTFDLFRSGGALQIFSVQYSTSSGTITLLGGDGATLAPSGLIDLNGVADGLVLDADGDTTISSPTDDQIDFEVASADQLHLSDGKLWPAVDDDIDLGDSTHEFKDAYFDGTIHVDLLDVDNYAAIGAGAALNPNYMLSVRDTNINTTSTIRGIDCAFTKTGGATDLNDPLYGLYFSIAYNQAGGEIGNQFGMYMVAEHSNGTIGNAVGGARNLYAIYGVGDLNAGTITGSAYGIYFALDQEAAHTIDGSVSAAYIWGDLDGTVTGTSYMLSLVEHSGFDYAIFHTGTAPSYFGGNIGVGVYPSARVHIDQSSTTAAIPVLKLDQADESEGFIDFIGTSAASAVGPISTWTAGNSIQGFVRVEINGSAYWMPFYNAPTS